jgi:anti-sigma regulatory factor (Ser/Thr protein kinase)
MEGQAKKDFYRARFGLPFYCARVRRMVAKDECLDLFGAGKLPCIECAKVALWHKKDNDKKEKGIMQEVKQNEQVKRCGRCKQEKPLSEFRVSEVTGDRICTCDACEREYGLGPYKEKHRERKEENKKGKNIIEQAWDKSDREEQVAKADLDVFKNIVEQAHEGIFMPEGGVLSISVKANKEESILVVEISDTGIGIEPDVVDKIFDPFFTTKPVGKGTGLGLSVVYGIVKKHEGYIEVKSSKGKGTTFFVYFPYIQENV